MILQELLRRRGLIMAGTLLTMALLGTGCVSPSPTPDDVDFNLEPPLTLDCTSPLAQYRTGNRQVEKITPGDIIAINEHVIVQLRQDDIDNVAIAALSIAGPMEDDLSYKSTTPLMNNSGQVTGLVIETMRGMGGLATFTTTFTLDTKNDIKELYTVNIQGACH